MYLRYLQTLLISTIHVKLKCSIGVTQCRNNVDIKIKLIRYDPNGVPNLFSLNNATCIFPVLYGVVLNYETKSKRKEQNETKRNEILRNATKYTKMRNETHRNETKFTIMQNEMK
jgi:hypothetical protein